MTTGSTAPRHAEAVTLAGHIVDSLTLSKVLDIILQRGGEYRITHFSVGTTRADVSRAEIEVSAETDAGLEAILHEIAQHGAQRVDESDASTLPAPADGVFPEGFHATTNLATRVRCGGEWSAVEPIEMDCGIVIDNGRPRCTPLHRVAAGDQVVVGDTGVRISPPERRDPGGAFAFMTGAVSTERPKELVVAAIAQEMRDARAAGRRTLLVGGPAIIHTGAGPSLEALIRRGWVNVLFAGNALAVHDIECAIYDTSLGVNVHTGVAVTHGHEHHLRAINRVRRAGSIAAAVQSGVITRGIMHACVETGTPFVLAGSIRDDGPLPDVITDTVRAQDAMRAELDKVGVALMVATTLHSVAVGNLLPASVTTLCVDSDADTVIKLADRGSKQAFGLVTDCEYFLKALSDELPDSQP